MVLESYKDRVEDALTSYFNDQYSEAVRHGDITEAVVENLHEYTLRGGKRIRPLLTIAAYRCYDDDDRIIDASIAPELLHSYLLIHDDIIDDDDVRRRGPAMHRQFADNGTSNAILAGDLGAVFAYDAIERTTYDKATKYDAYTVINWMVKREVYGQLLDLNLTSVEHDDALDIYELKTATYTTQGPIRLGTVLAGETIDDKLEDFAYNLGIAFQLQDDIRGVFDQDMDKPVDDLVEGKNSMLYAATLERCSDDQRDYLTTTYGTEMSKEDERTIKSIMRDTGAVEYCTDTFDELITSSRSALHAACLKKEGKKMLQDVLERVTTLLE